LEIRTIAFRDLLLALKRYAARLRDDRRLSGREEAIEPRVVRSAVYEPLRRLLLTDEVNRTLFAEFAAHRETERGKNETGWMLFGQRNVDEAIALATLPAGIEYDSSEAHVWFNSTAQAFASRVIRQGMKHLQLLGVVHTHPASLRHPTSGDYKGDIGWVQQLRGEEGVFGIGTADAKKHPPANVAWQPAVNVQCLGDLCFSWYCLHSGDRNYRQLPAETTIGPDLALRLRPVWDELENHAERLDRLAMQLNRVSFDVVEGRQKPALVLNVSLPEAGKTVRVLMEGKEVRYLLIGPDGALAADFRDDRVDRGVFVMLAELTT
jgi:hypothetical protein